MRLLFEEAGVAQAWVYTVVDRDGGSVILKMMPSGEAGFGNGWRVEGQASLTGAMMKQIIEMMVRPHVHV